ncbi:hypothetical protein Slin15195_G049210 [Septoria linicola]|uniref:Uncharacterized protein n=1 Tax=Septoria linicola TaxID=215465 RepID=A0A9Q9EIZ8_9PEZI|nr:hypothetical protein Slin15195_G049210 [Septoria linicola]
MEQQTADHGDATSSTALTLVYLVAYWLVYSIGFILNNIVLAVLWVLHLIYRPIAFTLQPVVYLVHFLLTCLALPFRALAQLETIYIYLGIAALLGVSGGLIISLVSSKITSTLFKPTPTRAKVRSVKDYRRQKKQLKVKEELPTLLLPPTRQVNGTSPQRHLSPGSLSPGPMSLSDASRRKAGLMGTTIMEEEDSEF